MPDPTQPRFTVPIPGGGVIYANTAADAMELARLAGSDAAPAQERGRKNKPPRKHAPPAAPEAPAPVAGGLNLRKVEQALRALEAVQAVPSHRIATDDFARAVKVRNANGLGKIMGAVEYTLGLLRIPRKSVVLRKRSVEGTFWQGGSKLEPALKAVRELVATSGGATNGLVQGRLSLPPGRVSPRARRLEQKLGGAL